MSEFVTSDHCKQEHKNTCLKLRHIEETADDAVKIAEKVGANVKYIIGSVAIFILLTLFNYAKLDSEARFYKAQILETKHDLNVLTKALAHGK